MRQRSALFDEMFNGNAASISKAEYKISSITNDDLREPELLWVDGLSNPEAFCVGNCYAGEFEFACVASAAVYQLNDRFQSYIRFVNNETGQASEWVLIGTYNIYHRHFDKNKQVVDYKARDNMILLEDEITIPETDFPVLYAAMGQKINAKTNVTIDLSNMPVVGAIQRPAFIEGMTMRDIFANMMLTTGHNARCTPDGIIKIYPLIQDGDTVDFEEWDVDEYADIEKPITGVNITGVDNVVYSAGNATGTVLNVSCPWVNDVGFATIMLSKIQGYVNKPMRFDNALINPCVEANDVVRGIIKGGTYKATNILFKGGASPRATVSNGLWEQFRKVGTLATTAGGGNQGGGSVIRDNIIITNEQTRWLQANHEIINLAPPDIKVYGDITSPIIIQGYLVSVINSSNPYDYMDVLYNSLNLDMFEMSDTNYNLSSQSTPYRKHFSIRSSLSSASPQLNGNISNNFQVVREGGSNPNPTIGTQGLTNKTFFRMFLRVYVMYDKTASQSQYAPYGGANCFLISLYETESGYSIGNTTLAGTSGFIPFASEEEYNYAFKVLISGS